MSRHTSFTRSWRRKLLTLAAALVALAGAYAQKAGAQNPQGKIAFDRNTSIYTMNADGTEQTKISGNIGGIDPAFSPDGTQLAFRRSYQVEDEYGTVVTQSGLYVAEVPTGAVTSLNCPDGSNPAYKPAAQQPDPTPTPTPTRSRRPRPRSASPASSRSSRASASSTASATR